MESKDEYLLVGQAMIYAQELEFALYGIISHLSHLPEAKKEKRFRDLSPEKFLRGELSELKSTLGQIVSAFGNVLLISTDELSKFVDDRNLIAHNYWRLTKANIKGGQSLSEPEKFLTNFIDNCNYWIRVTKGLLYKLIEALAKREGREAEYEITKEQREWMAFYMQHAEKHLTNQARGTQQSCAPS